MLNVALVWEKQTEIVHSLTYDRCSEYNAYYIIVVSCSLIKIRISSLTWNACRRLPWSQVTPKHVHSCTMISLIIKYYVYIYIPSKFETRSTKACSTRTAWPAVPGATGPTTPTRLYELSRICWEMGCPQFMAMPSVLMTWLWFGDGNKYIYICEYAYMMWQNVWPQFTVFSPF